METSSTPSNRTDFRIDLERERSISQLLGTTAKLCRTYPWLFFALAALAIVPWNLIELAITGHGPFSRTRHEPFLERQSLEVVSLLIVSPLISAMHAHAVLVIGKGVRPRFDAVVASGMRVLPVVGLAEVVIGVATEIGLLLLLVPGVIILVRFFVTGPSAAIEQRGVRAAWRTSWELSRGNGWHILGVVFAILGPAVVIDLAARSVGGPETSFLALVLGIGVETLIASLVALTATLLYFDLTARAGHLGAPARASRSMTRHT